MSLLRSWLRRRNDTWGEGDVVEMSCCWLLLFVGPELLLWRDGRMSVVGEMLLLLLMRREESMVLFSWIISSMMGLGSGNTSGAGVIISGVGVGMLGRGVEASLGLARLWKIASISSSVSLALAKWRRARRESERNTKMTKFAIFDSFPSKKWRVNDLRSQSSGQSKLVGEKSLLLLPVVTESIPTFVLLWLSLSSFSFFPFPLSLEVSLLLQFPSALFFNPLPCPLHVGLPLPLLSPLLKPPLVLSLSLDSSSFFPLLFLSFFFAHLTPRHFVGSKKFSSVKKMMKKTDQSSWGFSQEWHLLSFPGVFSGFPFVSTTEHFRKSSFFPVSLFPPSCFSLLFFASFLSSSEAFPHFFTPIRIWSVGHLAGVFCGLSLTKNFLIMRN